MTADGGSEQAKELEEFFRQIMIASARKRVTKTDKAKSAYYIIKEQREVLRAAGLTLSVEKPEPVTRVHLLGETPRSIEASYYMSERDELDRTPEPRMGREFISSWLERDDYVLLGTDGTSLFAAKWNPSDEEILSPVAVQDQVMPLVSEKHLQSLVPARGKKPVRCILNTVRFSRSPAVAELVLRRAQGVCEFPDCGVAPILTTQGRVFLEVHHIDWLREGGEDHPTNAAALCPRCHRALHHSLDRDQMKLALINALNKKGVVL